MPSLFVSLDGLSHSMVDYVTSTSIVYNLSFIALVVPKIVVVDPCNLGFFLITPYLRKLELSWSRIIILILMQLCD